MREDSEFFLVFFVEKTLWAVRSVLGDSFSSQNPTHTRRKTPSTHDRTTCVRSARALTQRQPPALPLLVLRMPTHEREQMTTDVADFNI